MSPFGEGSDVKMQPDTTIDQANISFWNELCGSHLAKVIGITDASPRSLRKFDNWFLSYYPYIFLHIPYDELGGKDVLEVGLGYGTVSQLLAESGANYAGLDIASGPVEMTQHRLRQANLQGAVKQGSILKAPFDDNNFDSIITIGCLHHTGDVGRALDECYRLLRPGGHLMVMLYYAYSHRRWMQAPRETAGYWFRERFGYSGVVAPKTDAEKWSYDHNDEGQAAPHTDFISVRSLRKLTSKFSSFKYRLENINVEAPFWFWQSRRDLLKTQRVRWCGLEIYATLRK
jgi:SAM-dependent methyltransferase